MELKTAMKKIYELIESGRFPDESVSVRHWDRIELIEAGDKYNFFLERHPHLFGKPSIGLESSAFIIETYLYEYDPVDDKVSLIKKDIDGKWLDIPMLVRNQIMEWMNYSGEFDHLYERFKTESKVIKHAKSLAKNFPYDDVFICEHCDLLPDNFESELRREFKDCLVKEMVSSWELERTEQQKMIRKVPAPFPRVHYNLSLDPDNFEIPACSVKGEKINVTTNKDKVTCKRCLRSIKKT